MSLKNLLALQAQKRAVEATTPSPAAEAATPAPAKPGLKLGLNVLGGAAPKPQPKPQPKATPEAPAEQIFSLEDIATMDAEAAPPRRVTDHSGFFDEIEATAPDRPVDPDLTSQQLSFVEQLDGIYGVLHDPDMFAQSVRIIMIELQENSEYIKLVQDSDVHVMIRGMRNNMGLARIKKQEKSRKSGVATKKASRKKSSESDAAMELLNSLGFDDDD